MLILKNQQILANAEKMLSEENHEGISSSSDTDDDDDNKSFSENEKQESEESLDEDSKKRKSLRLRNQDPDFDPPSKLTRTALQTTMKEEQEKLLEKFRLRREKQDKGVEFKHVHNGDLRKLKDLYIHSQKNKVRRSNYGGYVTLPYKKLLW